MKKLLFFIDNLSGGGAESVLRTLVNHLDPERYAVTVQTVNWEDPSAYLVPGVDYRAINRCKTPLGKRVFHLWLRLCAQLKWVYPLYIKDDYDMEVAFLECGPTKMLAGSTNRQAVKLAWVHCDLEKKLTQKEIKKLGKYYAAYDRVVCVSEAVKESFQRLFPGIPAVVLPNVIDEAAILQKADAFPAAPSGEKQILTAGRLVWQKGFDRLIGACALLKEDGIPFHLRILGEGPERQALEQLIKKLDLEEQVTLPGFAPNPYPYIKGADLVACASRYEGSSTFITESLILGKPIVTTPCTGMAELLGQSEYGLITEDSEESLYVGMKKLLTDSAYAAELAAAARRRGGDFTKDTALERTEAFFRAVLAEKSTGSKKWKSIG